MSLIKPNKRLAVEKSSCHWGHAALFVFFGIASLEYYSVKYHSVPYSASLHGKIKSSPVAASISSIFFSVTTSQAPKSSGGTSFAELWVPPMKAPLTTIQGSCVVHETTCWDELQACIESKHSITLDDENSDSWLSMLDENDKRKLSFHKAEHSAVIIEFRPSPNQLKWAIKNMMDNLPVQWLIQVIGGPESHACVTALFPAEIALGKILFLTHDRSAVNQKEMYDNLQGDAWLFFQLDTALCSKQRHMIHYFLSKDYSYWGAPKRSLWPAAEQMCGTQGFSLRTRAFVDLIYEGHDGSIAPDGDDWLCSQAFRLMAEGKMGGKDQVTKPAPYYEEQYFCSETFVTKAPFGVRTALLNHIFTRSLYENCPELVNILPAEQAQDPEWMDFLCSLNLDRDQFELGSNTYVDFSQCPAVVEAIAR